MIYVFIFPGDVTKEQFEKMISSIGSINIDLPSDCKHKTFTVKAGRMNNDVLNVVRDTVPDALCFSIDVENVEYFNGIEEIATIEQIPVLRW